MKTNPFAAAKKAAMKSAKKSSVMMPKGQYRSDQVPPANLADHALIAQVQRGQKSESQMPKKNSRVKKGGY